MNRRNLLMITLFCWANIGLFYLFYLLKFEPIIVGVFREFTLIPSFLVGVICPILFLFSFLKNGH